jgi:cytochrome c oxidase assembly protein subunit 15
VLVVATGLAFLAAVNTRPRRTRLTWLAVAQPLGVVAQAVIGGFVVLAGLVWWSVAIHFMVSMFFVWMAVQLVDAAGDGDGPPTRVVPGAVRGLIATSTAVLAALLLAGTFVTASGPHAGDAKTPRLGLGVQATAQVHADILFGYLGLVVGIGFALAATGAPRRMWRRYTALVVLVLAQGALGGIQYALGVPEVLVSFHVLGAGLVTIGAAFLWSGTTERRHIAGTVTPTADLVGTAQA